MQYALLIYNPSDGAEQARRTIDPDIAAVLARPDVPAGSGCRCSS
jgi:hypothetical protein